MISFKHRHWMQFTGLNLLYIIWQQLCKHVSTANFVYAKVKQYV